MGPSSTPPTGAGMPRISMQRMERPEALVLDTQHIKKILSGKTVGHLLQLQKAMREHQMQAESEKSDTSANNGGLFSFKRIKKLFSRPTGDAAPSHLIEVQATEEVQVAFRRLKDAHVSSIPVTAAGPKGKVYVGCVSAEELQKFVILHACIDVLADKEAVDGPVSIELRKKILDEMSLFLHRPVQEVMNFLGTQERRVELPKFDESAPLDMLVDKFQSGTHKALVENPGDPENLHILGQIDLVRFLYEHASELDEIRHIPVERIMHKGVVSISERERALDGFVLMHKYHLSAIAVVSEEGRVVATLGVRDLRGLDKDRLSYLNFPIGFFLHQLHGGHTPRCVKKDESILSVVKTIYEQHWFGVWVCSSDMKPVGVVTLTDIIHVFAPTNDS